MLVRRLGASFQTHPNPNMDWGSVADHKFTPESRSEIVRLCFTKHVIGYKIQSGLY